MTFQQILNKKLKAVKKFIETFPGIYQKLYSTLSARALKRVLEQIKVIDGRIDNSTKTSKIIKSIDDLFLENQGEVTDILDSIILQQTKLRTFDKQILLQSIKANDFDSKYLKTVNQTNDNFGIIVNSRGNSFAKDSFYGDLKSGKDFKSRIKRVIANAINKGFSLKALSKSVDANLKGDIGNEVVRMTLKQLRKEKFEVAKKLGVDKFFLMVGPSLKTSRNWCDGGTDTKGKGKKKKVVKRWTKKKGKIFTFNEIDVDWRKQIWQGKNIKDYDPWTDIGGYGCIDELYPVSYKIAKRKRKNI